MSVCSIRTRSPGGREQELRVSTAGRGAPERRVGLWGESTQRPKGGTMFGFPKHSKFTSSIPQLIPAVPFSPFLIMHVLLRPQKAVAASWELTAQTGSTARAGVITPGTHQGAHSCRESAPAGAAGAPPFVLQMAFTAASWADLSPAAPARPSVPSVLAWLLL